MSGMGMLVGVARLAPSGIMSVPLGTTGVPEIGWPEPPSTTGTLRWLEMLYLLTRLGSPDPPVGVALLALSDNACLASVTSQLLATADVLDLTQPESPIVRAGRPGRLLLPGWMSEQRGCTLVPDCLNRVPASPRLCIQLTSDSIVNLDRPQVVHCLWTWARIQSVCQAGIARQGCGVEPSKLLRQLGCRPTSQRSIGWRASSLKPRNAATSRTCRSIAAEPYHLAAGADGTCDASLVGAKVMRPLIKLQSFDRTVSLDTFLTKFQRMASNLRWDDKDIFHHLCASMEGAVGPVLCDTGHQATTADIIRLLQTRFGYSSKQSISKQSCELE